MVQDEAFRGRGMRFGEDAAAGVVDGGCAAVVNVEWGVHSDAGVAMFGVVPAVEIGAE